MTDEKQKARSKILGELESIRSLLEDENGNPLDPPLLTDPLDDDEAPLLTVTWEPEKPESAVAHSTQTDEIADVEVEIPALEADLDGDIPTLEPDSAIPILEVTAEADAIEQEPQSAEAEAEDIVTRALKAQPRPSLFDDQPAEEPQAEPATTENDSSLDTVESEAPTPEQAAEKELRAEEQPGLFDVQPASEATKGREASQAVGKRDGAAPKKSENPFLPKHIRDRLSANRALQQEMVKSFTSPPYTPFPPPARRTTHDNEVDEQLIDQLVQRYLPKIEAELREKLRAVLREERESAAKPEHD